MIISASMIKVQPRQKRQSLSDNNRSPCLSTNHQPSNDKFGSPLANITCERTSDYKLKKTGIMCRVDIHSLLELVRQLAGHGSLSPVVARWRSRSYPNSHCMPRQERSRSVRGSLCPGCGETWTGRSGSIHGT